MPNIVVRMAQNDCLPIEQNMLQEVCCVSSRIHTQDLPWISGPYVFMMNKPPPPPPKKKSWADVLSSLTGRRVEFQHNICVMAADKEGSIFKECDILGPENHKLLPYIRAQRLPSKPSLRGTSHKEELSKDPSPPLYIAREGFVHVQLTLAAIISSSNFDWNSSYNLFQKRD